MARILDIRLRRDTSANWQAANPTLSAGEAGLDTTSGLLKIGDGSTAWNALEYAANGNRWVTAANNDTLKAGRRYILPDGISVTVPDLGQGAQIELLPGNGNWSTSTVTFSFPAGWTLVAGTGINSSRVATLVCDSAASKITIYA